jgi:hypothetical protein
VQNWWETDLKHLGTDVLPDQGCQIFLCFFEFFTLYWHNMFQPWTGSSSGALCNCSLFQFYLELKIRPKTSSDPIVVGLFRLLSDFLVVEFKFLRKLPLRLLSDFLGRKDVVSFRTVIGWSGDGFGDSANVWMYLYMHTCFSEMSSADRVTRWVREKITQKCIPNHCCHN